MERGFDSGSGPEKNLDAGRSLKPYEVPELIWKLVGPYFEGKYGVEFTQTRPIKPVVRPTVVWGIERRYPGQGTNRVLNAKGANFSHYMPKLTEEGYAVGVWTQIQTVIYSFAVFGTSAAEANEVMSDLEQALLESEGPIKKEYPEFTLTFQEQSADISTLVSRTQDETISRILLFQATIPVKYKRLEPVGRNLRMEISVGKTPERQRVKRLNNSSTYYLTVSAGSRVRSIVGVWVSRNGEETLLKENVDYFVRKDGTGTVHIEWNLDYGLVPAVDEDFYVAFTTERTVLVKGRVLED